MKTLSAAYCLAAILLAPSLSDTVLADVPLAYHAISQATAVPVDILYAVALAESGKRHNGQLLPWPWALNINGASVYCSNLEAATAMSHQAIQQQQAIDLGLMQISWRWHWHRFQDIDEALVPIKNLQVGAMILREQFELTHDWWIAVGRYHDPGQDERSLASAERYRSRVKRHWEGSF